MVERYSLLCCVALLAGSAIVTPAVTGVMPKTNMFSDAAIPTGISKGSVVESSKMATNPAARSATESFQIFANPLMPTLPAVGRAPAARLGLPGDSMSVKENVIAAAKWCGNGLPDQASSVIPVG